MEPNTLYIILAFIFGIAAGMISATVSNRLENNELRIRNQIYENSINNIDIELPRDLPDDPLSNPLDEPPFVSGLGLNDPGDSRFTKLHKN